MTTEWSKARLRDAYAELEDAIHALRTVGELDAAEDRRHEVRLSQADLALRRAEKYLEGAPSTMLLFRVRLAARRAARDLLPSAAARLARGELEYLERDLPRLRRLVEDEAVAS